MPADSVAGPDRPVPEQPAPRAATQGYVDWQGSKTNSMAASLKQTQSGLYDKLPAALAERGYVPQTHFLTTHT